MKQKMEITKIINYVHFLTDITGSVSNNSNIGHMFNGYSNFV